MSTQSTGPRSDDGKERSSLNATRHGLCSDRSVIAGEDAAEWEAFRDCVVRRWLPASVFENELAVRIALQMWRLRRVTRFETQLLNDALNDDPAAEQAADQSQPDVLPLEEALRRVQRYEAHVSRQLAQAVKLLEKAQAERRASEATGPTSEVRSQRSAASGRSAGRARGGRAALAPAGAGRGDAGGFVRYFRRRGCGAGFFRYKVIDGAASAGRVAQFSFV